MSLVAYLVAFSLIAAATGGSMAKGRVESMAGPWPQVCPGAHGSVGPWNETRCPAGATCCPNAFSVSGVGCCPWDSAVCCPSGFQCCPSGTICVPIGGSGYSEVYNCMSGTTVAVGASLVGVSKCPCKPGPALPPSPTLKNVLVIGDSLSIGYTPSLAASLADVALVQHAPWDVSDGGAEETAYGLQCLQYWLASPSGLPFTADIIMFNFGMHDYVVNCTPGNGCVPGQAGNTSVYPGELSSIALQLKKAAGAMGAKLLFALTTPMLCDASIDGVITGTLNTAAAPIMQAAGIPTLDLHAAIVAKCGSAPQASCFGTKGCWCPHCPPGYSWLATSIIEPAVRALL